MKKTSIISAVLIFTLLLLNLGIVNTQHAKAEGEVLISVAPSAERVLPGDSFTVDIVVDPQGADNIASIQTNFEFDPLLVQVDSVVFGNDVDLLWSDSCDGLGFCYPGIDNDSGIIGSWMMAFPTNPTFPSTTFTLLSISLTAKVGVSDTSYLRLPDSKHGKSNNDLIFTGSDYSSLPYIVTNSSIIVSDDSTSPADIADLAVSSTTTDSAILTWTASGDDDNTGTATTYDVRYSTSNITNETEWDNATQTENEPVPSATGTEETITVSGLNSGITYYFAMKASDEASNESGISNVASGTTQAPNTPPSMTSVTITSDNVSDNFIAYTDSTLTANPVATDAETEDDQITYSYQWAVNGSDVNGNPGQGEILTSNQFSKSDVITVTVTPNDGTDDGVSMTSTELTISNSTPTQPTVTVTNPAYESDDLVCSASGSTDADGGDNILYSYAWQKDDVLQTELTTNTVDNSLTSVDKVWKCIATPNDGAENGVVGEASVIVEADLVLADTTAPPAISDLTISNISNHTLKLKWTVPEGADSYDIKYSTEGITDVNWGNATPITSPSAPKPKEAGKSQSVEVNNLNSGTTYYFAMKVSDKEENKSGLSNIVSDKTSSPASGGGGGYIQRDKTPPGKAKGLSVKNNGSENGGGAGISWENPDDSDFSKVVIIRKEKGYPKNVNDGTKVYENNGNKFEDSDAEDGKVYYYSIYSYDKSGNYSEPMESMLITDKSLVRKNGGHKVYVVNNNKKQWITTSKVFKNNGYKWENIYGLTSEDIDSLEDGEDIKGSGAYKLIRSKNGNKVYAVKGNRRLWIPTAEAFDKNGYKWKDVVEVDDGEMNAYANIKLIKEAGSPKVYYIYSGTSIKRWIPTVEIFLSYSNKWEDIETVDKVELDGYSDIKLIRKNGDYRIYYLENGAKRHIITPSVFASNGFNWNDIVSVNEIEFNYYQVGEDLR